MSHYRATLRYSALLSSAAAGLLYLSGCASGNYSPNSSLSYEAALQRSAMSQQERYDIERRDSRNDLLKKIDPEIKESLEDVKKDVEQTVGTIFPRNPKIKSSKLVWELSWDELRNLIMR